MAFSHRLLLAVWFATLSLKATASMVDIARFAHSDMRLSPRSLTYRQTDPGCPDDGDCDCTDWGADCDIADWSWVNCTILPDACSTSSTSSSVAAPPSTSRAPSTTIAPPTTTPPPPTATIGALNCIPSQSCLGDVHSKDVSEVVSFMTNVPVNPMSSSSPNFTEVTNRGVNYISNVGWIPGCNLFPNQDPTKEYPPSGGGQPLAYQQIIINTYEKCIANAGLGGWYDVGCLRMGFYPNDGYNVKPGQQAPTPT
ncbi:MAG: hypothetical protein Q9191_005604, partial [Dirinaria sp. TL-2023a]